MQADMTWFGRLQASLAQGEVERNCWKWLLLCCAAAWAVSFGLRMFDLSVWGHPGLQVGEETILSTHDAYLWLAAAEGVRGVSNSWMPELTNALSALSGMTPGQVGFWMPAVFAGLVGMVCVVWGWLLGGRWAGLTAGLIGANVPGFFYRTRLGYYDTDLFILAMPLMVALCFGLLMHGRMRCRWLPGGDEDKRISPLLSDGTLLLWAVAFGLAGRFGSYWHAQILTVTKLLLWGAVVLVFLLAEKSQRKRLLQAVALFGIVAFIRGREIRALADIYAVHWLTGPQWHSIGWVGVFLGVALAVALVHGGRRKLAIVESWWVIAALFVCMLLFSDQFSSVAKLFGQALAYLKPITAAVQPAADSAAVGSASGGAVQAAPIWPSITQSVIEAKAVDWAKVLQRLGPTPWLSVVGIIGYLAVVAVRPVAILLAPFLALGLAGGVLGIRFTMFGGPVVALGLGVPLCWAVRRLPAALLGRAWVQPAANLALGLALLAPLAVHYSDLTITPVLDKPFGETLVKLGDQVEDNARLWTWWDFGYAAQYYAKTMTVTDGGDHAGAVIFPEALAFTTDSFRLSTQVMKYTALHEYKPYLKWAKMPASEVKGLLDRMKMEEVVQEPAPPQYVAVSWRLLNLMGWISYYGTWDLESGQGTKHKSSRVRDFTFDPRGYVVFNNKGKALPVSSVDLLDGGPHKHKYFSGSGPHLVMNKQRKEAYLLDDVAYESVLVQLLIGQPGQGLIGRYFELVVDDSPHARVYRVR